MDNLKVLTESMYDASLPSSTRIPGVAGSTALERIFAMMIADYLGDLSSGNEWCMDILYAKKKDSIPMRLGVAFAALMQLNMGNRYGAVTMIAVLKSFAGTEVSPEVAELLQMLEEHVKAAGGKFIPDNEEH